MPGLAVFRRTLAAAICSSTVLLSWPLWADLDFSQAFLDKVETTHSLSARQRFEAWQTLLETARDLPDLEQLTAVNDFFNRHVLFMNDSELWGQEDYWATPIEVLSVGAGDCEDYSIAKYFTLVELGMDEEKLRLTYVKATAINQAHMVLTYFENRRAVPLVLDNLIEDIKPASQRTDLVPVYSFNGNGLWLARARGEGQRVGDATRLSLWEDVRQRMRDKQIPPALEIKASAPASD